jgi:hypothetical protein
LRYCSDPPIFPRIPKSFGLKKELMVHSHLGKVTGDGVRFVLIDQLKKYQNKILLHLDKIKLHSKNSAK